MSILINEDTRVIVQGITGRQGQLHTRQMLDYGTRIVAGVTPGKGGEAVEGIPVYNSIPEALQEHKADYSIIFVPASHAKKAAIEAIDGGLNVVIVTEGIPVNDSIEIIQRAGEKGRIAVGPNSPGICSVGKSKLGIMPNPLFTKGDVGIVSRSGTLTYEVVSQLGKNGFGESTCIGIGGDLITGSDFNDVLSMFERDSETRLIVLIGEIGGSLEERAAEFIKKSVTKKVIAYIAGVSAPAGKTMGHAGALINEGEGSALDKIEALERAGVRVARLISDIPRLIKGCRE